MLPDFNNVVDCRWQGSHGREDQHTFADCNDNPVPMGLDRSAKDTVANGADDQAWDPRGVQTVLAMPDATVPFLQSQWQSIVEENTVDDAQNCANPRRKVEIGDFQWSKLVAALGDGELEDEGQLHTGHDIPTVLAGLVSCGQR